MTQGTDSGEVAVLCLDLGTTHIKAFAYGLNGRSITSAHLKTESPKPGKQNAAAIFDLVLQVLGIVCKDLIVQKTKIAALSISAAMHSILPVDANGKPLALAMIWSDLSSAELANSLKHSERGNEIYAETGTPIHPMSPMIKIAWLRDNEKTIFRAAHKFISIKEYVYFHLTGVFQVDYSIASSSGLFKSAESIWSAQALDFAGIDESSLSKPGSPYSTENILIRHALSFGLTHSFPVVSGGGDGCLATLGAAPLIPGNISLGLGTSGAVRSSLPAFMVDTQGRTFTYRLDEKYFITGGASNNAGGVMSWMASLFFDQFAEKDVYPKMNAAASAVKAGSAGLHFIPYIFGERAPLYDPFAKGAFTGISNLHSKAHFVRAAMEGILFNMRYILELIDRKVGTKMIYTSGGLTAQPLWLQTMADILNKPLIHSNDKEDSAAGAAIIAMVATGLIKNVEDQAIFYTQGKEILPEPAASSTYEEFYQRFVKTVQEQS